MKKEFIDQIFSSFSKVVIFVPVVIIIAGLIIKFNQTSESVNKLRMTAGVVTPTITTLKSKNPLDFLTGQISGSSSSGSLDLNGPLICQKNNVVVSIKSKRFFVQSKSGKKTDNYLYWDDCLYQWTKNANTGQKYCGLGQYLSIIEMAQKWGVLNNETLLPILSQFGNFGKTASDQADIQSVIASCQKKEISNEAMFEIPKTVKFSAADISTLRK